METFGCYDPPIAGFVSLGRFFSDLWCKSCQDLMPECDENIVNIDVFMRLHFPAIFMALACNWRPWVLILEGFEGPGLPYRPPGYAMLQTAEIHDFQAGPGILGPLDLEGD